MKLLGLFSSCILGLLLWSGCNAQAAEDKLSSVVVTNLKCVQFTNPLGIDEPKPRLSWTLESNQRGQKQSLYQVLVASSLDKLDKGVGDLWDSGSVESDKSLNIAYNGSALKLRTQYFWKVRISDASGTMTAWSTPTSLTMGMLSQDDWQANWIQSDLKLFDYQKELMQHADHNMEVEDSLRPRGKRISKMTEKVKENWQGGLVQMPSLARPIGAWFYRSLGGIRAGSPGFKSVIIQPYTNTLEWVNTTYESPYGTIESNWQKKDDVLTMNVVIPANTTATVYVPGENVTESGMSAENSEGVDFNKNENGVNIFNVKAGEYNFIS